MIKQIEHNFNENIKRAYKLGNIIHSKILFECISIVEKHQGLVVFISSDINKTLELKELIQQFTNIKVIHFQDWETLPFDCFSPHPDIVSSRLAILNDLQKIKKGLLIISLPTLLQKICSSEYLIHESIYIYKNDILIPLELLLKLEKIGYKKVFEVAKPGEFSCNMSLVDVYPMGNTTPCRIHFSDENKIIRLQSFNVCTQRTFEDISSIVLMPKNEFPIHQNGMNIFFHNWKKYFNIECQLESIYHLGTKKLIPGIEYWQPLFFKNDLVTLFDYLSTETLFIHQDTLEKTSNNFWKKIVERYNLNIHQNQKVLTPKKIWITTQELLFLLKKYSCIQIIEKDIVEKKYSTNSNYQSLPVLSHSINADKKTEYLLSFLRSFTGKVIFSLIDDTYLQDLLIFLKKNNIIPKSIQKITDIDLKNIYFFTISKINSSFIDKKNNFLVICEKEFLPLLVHKKLIPITDNKKSNTKNNKIFKFQLNHPIIHFEHGIGRYQGLQTLEIANIKSEYLVILYSDHDKLYVPISSFHLITPYTGISQENVPLHKLGSLGWIKEKNKISNILHDHAVKLLDIYAHRASKKGFGFQINKKQYQRFCNDFPFQMTMDQDQAIQAILNDMQKFIPMDRVVCGDVGFGKTEVAMRASFIAVSNQKQVAILVPTTLLAQQHLENFKKRFSNWCININMLSRFCTKKQKDLIIEEIQIGKINILIGTHKILLKNIHWHNIGLLIIDEEHRFGVRHKEVIQQLHSNIDILTLTATPIPRTLNMAMTGIKDLSIIAKPPSQRLSVKTFVYEYNPILVREAILREILRGGQVYYIYNKIKNINNIAIRLSSLIPEAQVKIGHSRMHNKELKKVMQEFYQKKFNVLVCTTIIESGIDIPSVNTIIIENADHFGMSQLHQLRGRVGRSHHQAYAWLLVKSLQYITEEAKKRLDAIVSIDNFGAGFSLASQDLEIRGFGELLGKEQSGHIHNIGFNLYIKLLKNTIKSIQQGKRLSLNELIQKQPKIELQIPILLPQNYIIDVDKRLYFYTKLANTKDRQEIKELECELFDRFGNLPNSAKNLIFVTEIRILSQKLGINHIKTNNTGGFIEFNINNLMNTQFLLTMFKEEPLIWKMENANKLKFIHVHQNDTEKIMWIIQLLKKFIHHIKK